MSRKKISMRKIREVLRLKHDMGLSNRGIARSMSIGQGTVWEYLARARKASQEKPVLDGLCLKKWTILRLKNYCSPLTQALCQKNPDPYRILSLYIKSSNERVSRWAFYGRNIMECIQKDTNTVIFVLFTAIGPRNAMSGCLSHIKWARKFLLIMQG